MLVISLFVYAVHMKQITEPINMNGISSKVKCYRTNITGSKIASFCSCPLVPTSFSNIAKVEI